MICTIFSLELISSCKNRNETTCKVTYTVRNAPVKRSIYDFSLIVFYLYICMNFYKHIGAFNALVLLLSCTHVRIHTYSISFYTLSYIPISFYVFFFSYISCVLYISLIIFLISHQFPSTIIPPNNPQIKTFTYIHYLSNMYIFQNEQ